MAYLNRVLLASARRSYTKPAFKLTRRYASTQQADAFLEPVSSMPGVQILRLNRPQARNAISRSLLKNFDSCLREVQANSQSRALLIASTSSTAFCAGADLAERATMSKQEVDEFLANLRATLSLLESLEVPTVAAIDGPALGGGLELALACDLRVAGAGASKIGLPETKLGIIPGAGGTQRLTRLLGLSKAKEIIFTGKTFDGPSAKEWGIVDRYEQDALSGALGLAQQMSSGAPLALRAAKRAISKAPELTLESGLDFERACYEPLLSSQDRLEALEAFKMKRKPNFQGK